MPRLPPLPRLAWSEAGPPKATAFGDVYFSEAGGLAESEAVFLQGTGLPQAWSGRDVFSICELGFGSGLNALAAWRAWKATRSPHAVLHISSIEAFPLTRKNAERALSGFPDVSDLAMRLLERWPVRAYAPQRMWFEEDRFALTLFTGDAETVLSGLCGPFDAWFLDGFAPARNPAMWTPEVFRHIARLSAPDACLATFSVAGDVRRGLEAAGFVVEKKPGHGGKRERLEARRQPHRRNISAAASIYPYAATPSQRVAIVGAGVAGAACAHALARRGVETVVLEAAGGLGAGASGNPAGLVMPRLDRGAGPLREVFLAAYLHAIATYEALGEGIFHATGVEQLAETRHRQAFADLLNDPPLPEDWLIALPNGAALHPRAGMVSAQAAVRAMLTGARVLFEAEVQSLDRSGAGWVVRAHDGRALLKADAVVLACGTALTRFTPASFVPIALSHGQIEWGEGPAPPRPLVRSNYVAPFEGGVLFGATFDALDHADAQGPPCEDARSRNIAALAQLAPQIAAALDVTKLTSRAAVRAATPDRAPIAGLLPDAEAWLAQYAGLAHGRKLDADRAPPAHPGVYVLGGLGARGLTLAPLLAERLASEICGEPLPLSRPALDAIHPARFLHRALKRR